MKFTKKGIVSNFFALSLTALTSTSMAAPVIPEPIAAEVKAGIPSSTEPGVLGNVLSAPPIRPAQPQGPATATAPQEKKSLLGPQAAEIKFKLTKIYLDENRTFTEAQLRPIYADKLNKTISVADLEGIVQSITNFYRNNGYILSRAVLPPQHVVNGVVHIRIIEGYISNVKVQGDPKRARCLLQAYGNRIAQVKPAKISVMEHYLRIANEIPGMDAKAVLEPSKEESGASDMDLVANEKTFSGYLSYDNYGTLYIGPNQVTASITGNSIYQSGDSTHLTTVRTTRPQELQYVDISHEFPLGTTGLRGSLDANSSRTQPGLNLAPLKISGDAVNINGTLNYPLIRSREQDLSLNGGFYYIDSGVNVFDATLYNDHLRTARVGADYTVYDRFRGANQFSLYNEDGFLFFGASSNPTSPTVSRFGADGHFGKFVGVASRLQQIHGNLSAFIYTTAQYAFEPLLATEQFAYGGSQLGRGYDPAEIIGDRGAAGSIEVRYDIAPSLFKAVPVALEPYIFYDAGVIWNLKDVPGVLMKQSCTSAGFGLRFTVTKYLSGNLMFAQPLTKQVQAEEIVGRGRLPRTFFSFVASI